MTGAAQAEIKQFQHLSPTNGEASLSAQREPQRLVPEAPFGAENVRRADKVVAHVFIWWSASGE
jgi:hypothetical protein